jgi:hypothetical protein
VDQILASKEFIIDLSLIKNINLHYFMIFPFQFPPHPDFWRIASKGPSFYDSSTNRAFRHSFTHADHLQLVRYTLFG